MKQAHGSKAFLFAVLSVLLGIFLAVLGLEVVLRFFPVYSGLFVQAVNAEEPALRFVPNREFTYSRGWNFRGANTGHINNFGFINDVDYDPTARSPLAIVIGDSYVEALMVPFRQTLHGRLAELAHGRGRVYSIGVSGAALSQYLAYSLWAVKTFHPDLLVITIVGNDFDESLLRYKNAPGYHYFDDSTEEMPLVRVDVAPAKIRLSGISALYRYLKQNLGFDEFVHRFRSPNVVNYVGNVPASVGADREDRSKRAIDVFLARLSKQTGIAANRIILAVDGMRPALYSDDDLRGAKGSYFDVMRRYLAEQATQLGYTVVDLQPGFIGRHRVTGERFEYPDDGHWNGIGHGVAAEAVSETRAFRALFGL